MSVESILSRRLADVFFSSSDSDFLISISRFYRAFIYSYNFLNRNNPSFYELVMRDFYIQLRSVGKDRLLYCIQRIFPREFSSHFSACSTFSELIECLNPLYCMARFKVKSFT